MRKVLKPVLEVLAGIPSVVYGYFALSFVAPELLNDLLGIERRHVQRARRRASCSAS